MDGYATHLQYTVRAALEGRVLSEWKPFLELGCGDYSTPVLREIAESAGVGFDCFSTDQVWGVKHGATIIPSWTGWKPARQYGFCLLDNELLVVERFAMLPMLSRYCRIIVFHDSSTLKKRGIMSWDAVRKYFDRIEDYEKLEPGTAILYSKEVRE